MYSIVNYFHTKKACAKIIDPNLLFDTRLYLAFESRALVVILFNIVYQLNGQPWTVLKMDYFV
jgi:hypothetical protein